MQRVSYNTSHLNTKTMVYQQQFRGLADRSFRLANLLDIKAGQEFKKQISSEHYHPFFHSSQPNQEPDLFRQVLIDARDKESDYRSGHIKHAIWLPRNYFNSYNLLIQKVVLLLMKYIIHSENWS